MKIGLVCPYSMARGGGVQEIVRAMYKELAKRGHDVKIITPQPRDFDGVDTEGLLFVGSGNDSTFSRAMAAIFEPSDPYPQQEH
jgi:glycosyltransferase involved in cell wall biosynthesis